MTPSRWYISFGDVARGWLGACFVMATDPVDAVRKAWRLGVNPGGEALIGWHGTAEDGFPQEAVGRLFTDLTELSRYTGELVRLNLSQIVSDGCSVRDLGASNGGLRPTSTVPAMKSLRSPSLN